MKTRVQIIAAERRENVYASAQGNRTSVSFICQCAVFGEKIEVGVLRVPLAVAEPVLDKDGQFPPGFYDLEYALVVSFQDRSIGGRLASLTRFSDAASSPIGRLPSAQPAAPVKTAP